MKRTQQAREEVELVDGRVYWSNDNWQTVWRVVTTQDGTRHPIHVIDKSEADRIRFIAIMQTGAGT